MPTTASQAISSLFDTLRDGGPPSAAQLAALSDLGRHEAAELRHQWPSLDVENRAALLALAGELTFDDVGVDFTELGRVGLADADPDVRRLAVELLWESEHPPVGEDLLTLLLKDDDIEVRLAAAAGLRTFVMAREFESIRASIGDAIVDGLLGVASDHREPPELRAAATESLGPRSLPEVTRVILDAYDDDDPRMQLAALRAMGSSADERWVDYILDRMESADPDFRREAATAAGSIGSGEAVEGLSLLLEDDTQEVVTAAIEALGFVGGDEALRILQEFAQEAEPEYQDAIAEAIEAVREYARGMGEGA